MITQCFNCAHCYDTLDNITKLYISMCDVKGRNILLIDNKLCPHYKKTEGSRVFKENDEADEFYLKKICNK